MAVLGIDISARGGFLRESGRTTPKKDASFRNILDNSMGTNRSDKVPYGYLAKDGVITYNGVTFVCDYEKNAICLGDMSNPKQVLTVPLSGGGSLMVNRSNIGQLSKAIGMFSPEDINRILRAIALDAKCQQELHEIDEMEGNPDNFTPEDTDTETTGTEDPEEEK